MSEVARSKLFATLAASRREGRRPNPVEIAHIARDAGMTLHETLDAVRTHVRAFDRLNDGVLENALSELVSSLIEEAKGKRILEITAGRRLLTSRLASAEGPYDLAVFSRSTEFAEMLRLLTEGLAVGVSTGVPSPTDHETFDGVVCSLPLGMTGQGDDGFGSQTIAAIAPALAEGGTLYWVTARGLLFSRQYDRTFSDLADVGLHVAAVIDLAPGAFAYSNIEGALIILRRKNRDRKLVGVLRDDEGVKALVSALKVGPVEKQGANWAWLDVTDRRSFSKLEHERLLRKLKPKGRHQLKTLKSLLARDRIERADRPSEDESGTTALLFVPEYAGSRVTADLEEQTVKAKAVYRLAIDGAQANPRFLAQLLNSPYGKQLRSAAASGLTIQRVSVEALLALELPIPNIAIQDRLARVDGDIGLLQAAFRDMQAALEEDWTSLDETLGQIDALKAILDIERRIDDWWRELPYPLATIYRRYRVSKEPKDRLETLLHFFEMFALYLAAVGTSHVKALRQDWEAIIAKWLHPTTGAGIERADFGFWIQLASTSLKDTARITGDPDLQSVAAEIGGAELVQAARALGGLGKATDILHIARRYRNSWIGHGGHMKSSDAARLEAELQQQIRDLYEVTAATLRRLQLVRPGMAEVLDTGMRYKIEKLSGSDPTFEIELVEIDRPAKSNALAFWMSGSRTMCRAIPFFRLGLPQQPRESSFYVYNRIENGGFRWISYQEASEQEFVAPDNELSDIIALGRAAGSGD